jgi:hypothetical protein
MLWGLKSPQKKLGPVCPLLSSLCVIGITIEPEAHCHVGSGL